MAALGRKEGAKLSLQGPSEGAVQASELTVPRSSRLPATPPKGLLVRAEVSERGSQGQPRKVNAQEIL